ncbi:MAG: trypsin-like peptidase domain-containing protein [Candidatus Moranbacteria bacterium]|jgi:S1-C subfamily serine protease|nr:trypsin-like peptidase domain-containing protein [Candidatus Moranbacteria bacterium]MDD5652314.1 trypsin-like peptidase domain-containing protein [Candidatus Moranbacteria bacterium]MDX9856062.1 trypsin-like peptidase domain-containing protein [Candidatus Moranbacteria bacterium]
MEEQKGIKTEEVKEIKKKTGSKNQKVLMAAIFLSSFLGIIFGYLGGKLSDSIVIRENEIILEKESAVVDAVEKSSPAVVSIVVSKDMPKFRSFFDRGNLFDFFFDPFEGSDGSSESRGETERQEIGGGTGFFVSEDGLIVTNKHVVEDAEADYTVILKDEREFGAQVLARHPSLDVAVLKIEGDEKFPVLELGDSDKLRVGQSVIAIGNSLGEFANSVSLGIVSGLKRSITAFSGFGQSEELNDIIQTDAAINPGNSGGPLLDINGRVVGINVAIVSGAQSIGFALPINQIKKIVDQVKAEGKITIPYLGVRYVIIDEAIQKENNLPYNYGALVIRGEKITDLAVSPGSPADKAGIMENDVILEFGGDKINSKNMLSDLILKHDAGEEVEVRIWHKGEEKSVKVKLEERKN